MVPVRHTVQRNHKCDEKPEGNGHRLDNVAVKRNAQKVFVFIGYRRVKQIHVKRSGQSHGNRGMSRGETLVHGASLTVLGVNQSIEFADASWTHSTEVVFYVKRHAERKPVGQQVKLHGVKCLVEEHDNDRNKHSRKHVEFVRQESQIVGHFRNEFILVTTNIFINPLCGFEVNFIQQF